MIPYRRLKSLFDFLFAIFFLPFVCLSFVPALLIFLQDFHNPFYFAKRVGLSGVPFTMFKLRTMRFDSHLWKLDSTSATDPRVTPLGKIIRLAKLDEFPQVLNILAFKMSFVGPRPNTFRNGVQLYTDLESQLLSVLPGITDLSSIVFADEADILAFSSNPDLTYNTYIRPWKSRLSLFCVSNSSFRLDLYILMLTVLNFVHRPFTLRLISRLLNSYGVDPFLVSVVRRNCDLPPGVPPS